MDIGYAWVAANIDTSERVATRLDSMNEADAWAQDVSNLRVFWVVRDAIDKKHAKRDLIATDLDVECRIKRVEAVTYQTNGQDCGVFLLSFARDLLDRERMDTDGPARACSFDSEDMQRIRRALIWDILDHGLDSSFGIHLF